MKFIKSLSLTIGVIFLIFPFFLIWFIHGNRDRYLWIINGPNPFNQLGSGPVQLMLISISVIIGVTLLILTIYIKDSK
jgi:hypothetical protein